MNKPLERVDEATQETLEALSEAGWPEVEVYAKRGRSQTVDFRRNRSTATQLQEEGWAARAGNDRSSFFYAATGRPAPMAAWPEADGHGLRLPSARPVPRWVPPSDLDAPLIGEKEALALFEGLARELGSELPGARLLHGRLQDGSSESQLTSSREARATVRQRSALLYVHAQGPGRPGPDVSLLLPEREGRRFNPLGIARRLADRLLIAEKGTCPERDRGDFLLAPAVTTALLAALGDMWIGPEARGKLPPHLDRRGRLGSRHVTLIDNGRLPGGILATPVDGEGQPCRELTLIAEGTFRQPLLSWSQVGSAAERPSGCARRASWRDLPRAGATHLYLRGKDDLRVSHLLEDVRRGYYAIDPEGPARFDPEHGRFAMRVCGFAVEGGKATGPIRGAWLTGSVSAFLQGIAAVARDLTFFPLAGGMLGAPTLLARGLELRRAV